MEGASKSWLTNASVDDSDLVDRSLFDQYVASLYFSTATMTTMGYGDIAPVTTVERVVANFIMLVGALIYALTLSKVNTLMAALEALSRKYTRLVDTLNTFFEENRISFALRVESRRYLRTRQAEGNLVSWQLLLPELSPDIREDIASETHAGWCEGSSYLAGADAAFQAKAASLFEEVTFPSGEELIEAGEPVDRLFLIKKGVVGAFGRVLRAGDVLGDETIIDPRNRSNGFRASYVATALTFTVMDSLTVQEFEDSIGDFPDVRKRAQRRLNWATMRAHCWAYASAVIETRGRRPLRSAKNRDLVEFYRWKVQWFHVKGLDAVKLFRAVLTIQRVGRGYIQRRRLGRSKESGIGAVQIMATRAVSVAMETLYTRVAEVGVEQVVARARESEREAAEERRLLLAISQQIKHLAARITALEELEASSDSET